MGRSGQGATVLFGVEAVAAKELVTTVMVCVVFGDSRIFNLISTNPWPYTGIQIETGIFQGVVHEL